MKTALLVGALVCAVASSVRAQPTGTDTTPKTGSIFNAEIPSGASFGCTMADGKTTKTYYEWGNQALLSEEYMGDSVAAENCGKCIKVTTQGKDHILVVVGLCESCDASNFSVGAKTFFNLDSDGDGVIANVPWSFVPC
ncbi:hypothetical protein H4R18_005527 [Coemansia javaensis]|uniref:Barwin-like endoglucanase n=1 Tax=Coemansia javaensis TaxID=2761396 RepID=A0A9W8LEN9_9FUNG|nr:hypothetical protein H4R18_005527 [Coemansia javaensis]